MTPKTSMPGCRAWIMIINWAPNTTYRMALSEKVTDKYLRFTIFRENSILIFKNEYTLLKKDLYVDIDLSELRYVLYAIHNNKTQVLVSKICY